MDVLRKPFSENSFKDSCTLIASAHDVNDFSRIFPNLWKIFWRKAPATVPARAGVISSIAAARLFFAVRVMKAVISFGIHGMLHLVRQRRAMTVLERPHTLGVKKGDTVAVVQDVT